MNGIHRFIAPLVFLSLPAHSWASESMPQAAAYTIHDVVEVVAQECAKPATIQLNAHPLRAQVQRSGILPLEDLGYRVNFAKIADYREWVAAVRLHDRSRQVDDSYVLFTRTGFAPFNAAYVITRLPESIQDSHHALQTVLQLQKRAAGEGKTSFIETDTPFGRGVEMIVGNRVGSMCFPTSPFRYASSPQEASIGISRFVVNGRDLIEYALVLPWPEGMPQEEAVARAQARIGAFQLGLEAAAH